MLNRVGAGWRRSLLMLNMLLAACAGPPALGPAIAPPGQLAQPANANVRDQPSDLEGGDSERSFLLPNPSYRIL